MLLCAALVIGQEAMNNEGLIKLVKAGMSGELSMNVFGSSMGSTCWVRRSLWR